MTGVAVSALGPDAALAQATVGEVIVTAQKREQALQDVSLAVSAVGGDRLEQAQITDLQDLQKIVPSVTMGNDFNMAKIFVRGVGANTSTTGSETGVAVHVDGAVISRAEAQLTSLFDLERVEVLRGPQGALYGRNATGGSINLVTRKPTGEREGYVRATGASYNLGEVEAAIGGPITERILGRLAVKMQTRSGYGENPVTDKDLDDMSRRMARGHLKFLLSDRVDLLLTGEWFEQDDASGALHFRRASFPGVARLPDLGAGGHATNPRYTASEFDPHTDTETGAVTATLNWALNDSFTVTNIANYRFFDTSITQDLDLSAIGNSLQTTGAATTIQRRDVVSNQYSNELQLKYASEGLNGVFGLFYFHERQRPTDTVGLTPVFGMQSNLTALAGPTIQDPGIPGFAIPSATPVSVEESLRLCNIPLQQNSIEGRTTPPKRVCIRSDLGTQAWAAFGQVELNLGRIAGGLDSLTLKLGGRYSWEKRDSENPALLITRNGLGPVIHYTAEGTHAERSFDDFTPQAGVEWRPAEDLLVFYNYAEGFKSGAGENAAGSRTIVGPETIRSHEVGFKSAWLDDRVALNVVAFTYKLKGLQISKTINDPVAGFVTRFENAARTSAEGVEVELFANPVDDLRISGSLTYLDSQFDDFTTADPLDPRNVSTPPNLPAYDPVTNPTGFSPVIIQLAGNPTRNSPKWAWNLHAEYDINGLPLPGDGRVTLAGDVSHKSKVYFTEFARLLEGSEAYTMFDASITYTTADGRFSVSIWDKNITNVLRPASTFALATARVIGVTYLPPQVAGVTVGWNF